MKLLMIVYVIQKILFMACSEIVEGEHVINNLNSLNSTETYQFNVKTKGIISIALDSILDSACTKTIDYMVYNIVGVTRNEIYSGSAYLGCKYFYKFMFSFNDTYLFSFKFSGQSNKFSFSLSFLQQKIIKENIWVNETLTIYEIPVTQFSYFLDVFSESYMKYKIFNSEQLLTQISLDSQNDQYIKTNSDSFLNDGYSAVYIMFHYIVKCKLEINQIFEITPSKPNVLIPNNVKTSYLKISDINSYIGGHIVLNFFNGDFKLIPNVFKKETQGYVTYYCQNYRLESSTCDLTYDCESRSHVVNLLNKNSQLIYISYTGLQNLQINSNFVISKKTSTDCIIGINEGEAYTSSIISDAHYVYQYQSNSSGIFSIKFKNYDESLNVFFSVYNSNYTIYEAANLKYTPYNYSDGVFKFVLNGTYTAFFEVSSIMNTGFMFYPKFRPTIYINHINDYQIIPSYDETILLDPSYSENSYFLNMEGTNNTKMFKYKYVPRYNFLELSKEMQSATTYNSFMESNKNKFIILESYLEIKYNTTQIIWVNSTHPMFFIPQYSHVILQIQNFNSNSRKILFFEFLRTQLDQESNLIDVEKNSEVGCVLTNCDKIYITGLKFAITDYSEYIVINIKDLVLKVQFFGLQNIPVMLPNTNREDETVFVLDFYSAYMVKIQLSDSFINLVTFKFLSRNSYIECYLVRVDAFYYKFVDVYNTKDIFYDLVINSYSEKMYILCEYENEPVEILYYDNPIFNLNNEYKVFSYSEKYLFFFANSTIGFNETTQLTVYIQKLTDISDYVVYFNTPYKLDGCNYNLSSPYPLEYPNENNYCWKKTCKGTKCKIKLKLERKATENQIYFSVEGKGAVNITYTIKIYFNVDQLVKWFNKIIIAGLDKTLIEGEYDDLNFDAPGWKGKFSVFTKDKIEPGFWVCLVFLILAFVVGVFYILYRCFLRKTNTDLHKTLLNTFYFTVAFGDLVTDIVWVLTTDFRTFTEFVLYIIFMSWNLGGIMIFSFLFYLLIKENKNYCVLITKITTLPLAIYLKFFKFDSVKNAYFDKDKRKDFKENLEIVNMIFKDFPQTGLQLYINIQIGWSYISIFSIIFTFGDLTIKIVHYINYWRHR